MSTLDADAPGLVLASTDRSRAVYLNPAEAKALHDAVKVVMDRPTVAGPDLDATGWERLGRALDLVHEPAETRPAPIVLTPGEEAAYELLRRQLVIRANVPLRIRRTCVDCGQERIDNPARADKPDAQSGPSVSSLVESGLLATDGHPILAAMNLLGGIVAAGDQTRTSRDVCGRCDGDHFDSEVVTFCPGCRALRTESVLLTCTDCGFDFTTKAQQTQSWGDPDEATATLVRITNTKTLKTASKTFENALWPGQIAAFIEALGPQDKLLAMCRCALPGQVGRYVALLVTDRRLIWSRESPISSATGGSLLWTEVAEVRAFGVDQPPTERGFEVVPVDGPPVAFKDFRGQGLSLDDRQRGFTAADMLAFTAECHQSYARP